jgi:4-hydroxybutyrate CoA-transferase
LCTVSPPDAHGYCSFGMNMWNKKGYIQRGKTVLAEVDGRLSRTFGDNFIPVSEIDWFVEHTPADQFLMGKTYGEPEERHKPIAEAVNSLIRNGDTIQIGGGTTAHALGWLGAFEGKEDLGVHTEGLAMPLCKLVRAGQFTGKYKTLHTGKAVSTCFLGDAEDMDYMDSNPQFELYPVDYVNSIKVIAAHDNFVALNNALAVDLMGQISSESIGPRMWLGAGGQVEFALGATLSKGGRSIIVLPSTTHGGESRIVPMLPEGTRVTALWHFVEYVITEHGIARLLGKGQRQRIEELIAVAHPDHRAELRHAAKKLYG